MDVYTNTPSKPTKLDMSKVDLDTIPKSAILGNFEPEYTYKEVITRITPNGHTKDITKEIVFKEPNIALTRMVAFRHAHKRANAFHLMRTVASQVPINLSEGQGFQIEDEFKFEIWARFGESEDDCLLVVDSYDIIGTLYGGMHEAAILEMLLVPGANPAKHDYNPAGK